MPSKIDTKGSSSTPFDTNQLKSFPTGPGVYLMKNKSGKVLYVGKAINIRSRVRQYFRGGDGRAMIPHLIKQVVSIETIVVGSEKEALLLENTLIKKHWPKYNACLKDDKSYISLMVSKHDFPLLKLIRYKNKPDEEGRYFGPYTSAYAARQTLDLLQRIFPLRRCSDQEFARRTRPCLYYDMKRCCAPCVGKASEEEYSALIDRVRSFLKGREGNIIKALTGEMERASEAMDFERAGEILKVIRQIETTTESQKVVKVTGIDCDTIGLYRHGDEIVVTQMFYRKGKLVGSRNHSFEQVLSDDAELLDTFVLQAYHGIRPLPHEILLPCNIPSQKELEALLSEEQPHRVHLRTPQKGEKKQMVAMAAENAEASHRRERDEGAIRERTLIQMQQKLRLSNFPRRMECCDTSNISGSDPVASIVTFTDGKKESSGYRKYKVRTTEVPDDYTAMYEVLSRRFARKEQLLPDLLIVDGGKGQLNIALKVLQELNVTGVDVLSLAKEESRHDKGMRAERIFLPNLKDPMLLPKNSPILFMLQNIRDEAHRFAITFHRKRRSKGLLTSELDQIPGIGPVKKKRLLSHFGSLKKIKAATLEELLAAPGISAKDAEILYRKLRPQSAMPGSNNCT